MKNYFENNDPEWMSIIPFDKVSVIRVITDKIILVFDITSEKKGTEFPVEQLADYKQWLELKQQALEDRVKPKITIQQSESITDRLLEKTKKDWGELQKILNDNWLENK